MDLAALLFLAFRLDRALREQRAGVALHSDRAALRSARFYPARCFESDVLNGAQHDLAAVADGRRACGDEAGVLDQRAVNANAAGRRDDIARIDGLVIRRGVLPAQAWGARIYELE